MLDHGSETRRGENMTEVQISARAEIIRLRAENQRLRAENQRCWERLVKRDLEDAARARRRTQAARAASA